MGLLHFYRTAKIFFAAHLKQSSFWPLADAKPM
jgi:hypothetical protein